MPKGGYLMGKREQIHRKDNIILFPGIEKRLTKMGIDSLHAKNYTEAIELLNEAREYDPDNEEILLGLVIAYFEASAFQKAKGLIKEMLLRGIGDYFEMVDLYVTVLMQLHEYDEIIVTVDALLEEKEVPPDKLQHFLTLLQFSKKMAENHSSPQDEQPDNELLELFSVTGLTEQMLLVSNLAEKNIRPYLQEITEYLKAESGYPFLKTMLLTLLKEQEINVPVTVHKLSIEKSVIPTDLPDVSVQPKMGDIKAKLEWKLQNSNPALYENIISLVERIFFITYPFELQPESNFAWAAAFHIIANQYFGIDSELTTFAKEYEAVAEDIKRAIEQIESIEKISYSNL